MTNETTHSTHTHTRTRTRTTVERGGSVRFAVAIAAAGRRVQRWFARAREEIGRTVTPAGWVALVVAVGGLGIGFWLGWTEWVIAGGIALALLLLSLPFLFGARSYDVGLDLAGNRVVAGGSVLTQVDIRNHTKRIALPGRLDLPVGDGLIEIPVPLLLGGHQTTHRVNIPTPKRGMLRVGPAMAVRSDPIGLLHRDHEWLDVHDVFVHPRTVAVPATSAGMIRDLEGNPTSRLVDSDMSFHAIREYAPGDSQRQVHWKSTAKTGKLMVRQFEESRRSRMAIALSVSSDDYVSEDEYELAVSAAASLSVQALRDGRDIEVITGAEIPRVARGRVRAVRQLGAVSPRTLLDEYCAVDRIADTMFIEDVCKLQAEESPGLSIAFIICGSTVGLERIRRAALAYEAGTMVVAIIANETAEPSVRPISGLTVMTIAMLQDMPWLIARGLRS